jgi:hypothetical protein
MDFHLLDEGAGVARHLLMTAEEREEWWNNDHDQVRPPPPPRAPRPEPRAPRPAPSPRKCGDSATLDSLGGNNKNSCLSLAMSAMARGLFS